MTRQECSLASILPFYQHNLVHQDVNANSAYGPPGSKYRWRGRAYSIPSTIKAGSWIRQWNTNGRVVCLLCGQDPNHNLPRRSFIAMGISSRHALSNCSDLPRRSKYHSHPPPPPHLTPPCHPKTKTCFHSDI